MSRLPIVAIALTCVVWISAREANARNWSDDTGAFSIEAEFIKLEAGKVYLKRDDNDKTITVPLQRLSKNDRHFLEKITAQPAKGAKPMDEADDAAKRLSALAMVENWEIVLDSLPFCCRPGAKFSQQVFNSRVQEEIKWLTARNSLQESQLLAGLTALSTLTKAVYAKQTRLKLKVVRAFGSSLSINEHTQLAKAEAARPQSYFDARVREAFEWMVEQQNLPPQERVANWDTALAKSSAQLKAEMRDRYEKQCVRKPTP